MSSVVAERASTRSRTFTFLLIVSSTVLGMAGTDLVLPAVPSLPDVLGGTPAQAQLVLSAFVAGSAAGLLLFGALGARFDQRALLSSSLFAYALVSAAACFSESLYALVGLRFLQGAAGSAAAVFAPGIIRSLFGDERAVSAIGLLGSIEALTPALAPIAGLWLLHARGWRASFEVIAALALLLGSAVLILRRHMPRLVTRPGVGGYRRLLGDPTFLRYALSHAFGLGTLLVVVFGAPTVFVASLGAELEHFIIMQVVGITTFIAAANAAGRLVRSQGTERMLWIGASCSAAGAATLLVYAWLGGRETWVVTALFIPINSGFGLRGPPGFHRAVVAARGDDARGAALVVIAILGTAALSTAAVAPFITLGLWPLAVGSSLLSLLSLLVLKVLPPWAEAPVSEGSVGERRAR